MKYEIRTLCSKDIFPMSRIISKIGIGEFKKAINPDVFGDIAKKDVNTIGFNLVMELAGIVFDRLPSCEKEIYAFLSDLTGASIDDLKNDSMASFAELILEIFKKEEFKDFIGVASKLFK